MNVPLALFLERVCRLLLCFPQDCQGNSISSYSRISRSPYILVALQTSDCLFVISVCTFDWCYATVVINLMMMMMNRFIKPEHSVLFFY